MNKRVHSLQQNIISLLHILEFCFVKVLSGIGQEPEPESSMGLLVLFPSLIPLVLGLWLYAFWDMAPFLTPILCLTSQLPYRHGLVCVSALCVWSQSLVPWCSCSGNLQRQTSKQGSRLLPISPPRTPCRLPPSSCGHLVSASRLDSYSLILCSPGFKFFLSLDSSGKFCSVSGMHLVFNDIPSILSSLHTFPFSHVSPTPWHTLNPLFRLRGRSDPHCQPFWPSLVFTRTLINTHNFQHWPVFFFLEVSFSSVLTLLICSI